MTGLTYRPTIAPDIWNDPMWREVAEADLRMIASDLEKRGPKVAIYVRMLRDMADFFPVGATEAAGYVALPES